MEACFRANAIKADRLLDRKRSNLALLCYGVTPSSQRPESGIMRMGRAAMTLWSTSLTRSRTRVSRLIISYGLRSFTAATPRPTIRRPERQRSETEWNALSAKPCKPLRILFCGSDEFSIAALKAIHELRKWHPDYIKSIDVLCRPGKRTGRGMKVIATSNEVLSIHQLTPI